MQTYTSKKYLNPGRVILLLMALIVFLPCGEVLAQESKKKKKKKKVKHFEVRIGLTTSYDNNILKYSDKYLDRFMNNEDPGRFHIETYDDMIINPYILGDYTFKIFKNVNTKINASFSPRFYLVNGIKNWLLWGEGFAAPWSPHRFHRVIPRCLHRQPGALLFLPGCWRAQ